MLVEQAILIPGVRSAGIDLAASTCVLQFDPGGDIPFLAGGFADALRSSQASPPRDSRSESRWEALAAFKGNPSVNF